MGRGSPRGGDIEKAKDVITGSSSMTGRTVQCVALTLDLCAEKSERNGHKPLKRAAVACVENGCRALVGTSSFAPVFVPGEQLGEHVRALHHISRIIQESGEPPFARAQPFPSNPFEGLELSGGAIALERAAGVGASARRIGHGASKDCGLLQPPSSLPKEGGSSNGLEDRAILAETGRARALPFEPPKLGRERKSRRPCAVTAAFVAGLQRASKPDLAHHEADEM